MKLDKKWINLGSLAGVFLVAVVFFSYLINRGNDNMTADLGTPSLPTVSFSTQGYMVNPLVGYKRQMKLTTMRDTVTPVQSGQLVLNIEAYDRDVQEIHYQVYTLNGQDLLFEERVADIKSQTTLQFPETAVEEETMLVLTLNVEGEDVYYYTRLKNPIDCNLMECMDYVYELHNYVMHPDGTKDLKNILQTTIEGSTENYYHVTQQSDEEHVTWGALEPKLKGSERFHIVEVTPGCTSIKMEYEVECKGEKESTELYSVEEYFTVRKYGDVVYLLAYDRTAEQMLAVNQNVMDEKGILLGVTGPEITYMANEKGNSVSFVQAGELWNYNQEKEELSLLFSFMDAANMDPRNMTDQHEMHIVSVDEAGDTVFWVSGYMNRGPHEGFVGSAVYYYDSNANCIEEKLFIPCNQSAAVLEKEQSRNIYYSVSLQQLYVLAEGELLQIDMQKGTREVLVSGLEKGQYVVSDDRRRIAYQTNGPRYEATEIQVLDLETGEADQVLCETNECVVPIGFVYDDFVVGTAKKEQSGTDISGQSVVPMYKVEIRNTENQVIKTHQEEQVCVLDASIESGMLILNRVVNSNGIYTPINADYITNNEEKEKSPVSVEAYHTDQKGNQMRLTFAESVREHRPKILKPKQVQFENMDVEEYEGTRETRCYYAYGNGKLLGVYESAGEAIQAAGAQKGTVVTQELDVILERGNRYLTYQIAGEEESVMKLQQLLQSGKRPLEAVREIAVDKAVDLTGCNIEDVLYLINTGVPVVGMRNKDQSILLTGYTEETVHYIETDTGNQGDISYEEMDLMLSGSGHVLVSYVK